MVKRVLRIQAKGKLLWPMLKALAVDEAGAEICEECEHPVAEGSDTCFSCTSADYLEGG